MRVSLNLNRIKFTVAVIAFVVMTTASADAFAQSASDISNYLGKRDKNQNGLLDPSEYTPTGRTNSWLKELGFDTSKPIPIKKIASKAAKENGKEEKKRDDDSRSRRRNEPVLKVPGFGPSDEMQSVSGFGASDVAPLSNSFSERVTKEVRDTMNRWDKNQNGRLDANEIKMARWGSPRPEESDTNGDGKLSRIELSNRYFIREQYSRKARETKEKAEMERKSSESKKTVSSRFGRSSSKPSSTSSGRSSYKSGTSSKKYTPSKSYASKGKTTKSTSSGSSSPDLEKTKSYVKGVMSSYDTDKDGSLSKDELKKMRNPIRGADTDNNGSLSESEIVDFYMGGAKSSDKKTAKKSYDSKRDSSKRSDSKRSYRGSSSGGSVTKATYSSRTTTAFQKLDADGDSRIKMYEYSDDWDDEVMEGFTSRDKNGDGIITLKEWTSK